MPQLLMNVPALADAALLVLRLVAGGMFALSGYFKLTDPERRQKMARSLEEAKLPRVLTPAVSLAELAGGVLVLLGLLTAIGSVALLIISLGALLTTSIAKAEGEGIGKVENVLYAPEPILCAALLVLLAVGAGTWSLDAMLA